MQNDLNLGLLKHHKGQSLGHRGTPVDMSMSTRCSDNLLRILQVNLYDVFGGAEKVAWSLFQGSREAGHRSWLAVAHKQSNDPDVLEINNDACRSWWTRLWLQACAPLRSLQRNIPAVSALHGSLTTIGEPRRSLERWRGIEDFNFPRTWSLLELAAEPPDILHCHNLHGDYFDLRALPSLSHQMPVIATLHDMWLFTGHCHYPTNCERWKTGCGRCPDLTSYPAIHRDATDYNWRRKQDIYARSRFYIATPSQWLMREVEQSMLASVVAEARVMPLGVDLSTFHPADKQAVRRVLGIPQDAAVLLSSAVGICANPRKDFQTIRHALTTIAGRLQNRPLICIALGDDSPPERVGQAKIHFIPYQKDPVAVARYYQAADVYVHAATAEVWGITVTEALACGTPVVATAVGGIPEQVKAVDSSVIKLSGTHLKHGNDGPEDATGALVPPRDPELMAQVIVALLNNEVLLKHLARNAEEDAKCRFDLKRMVSAYLQWYHEILERDKVTKRIPDPPEAKR